MIDTNGTGQTSTNWYLNDYCTYLLPCGRCKLTMDRCPEAGNHGKITLTSVTWPDKTDSNMTLFADKDYQLMTTTAAVTDDGKDMEKKKLRC